MEADDAFFFFLNGWLPLIIDGFWLYRELC